jgi:hypothetical protein
MSQEFSLSLKMAEILLRKLTVMFPGRAFLGLALALTALLQGTTAIAQASTVASPEHRTSRSNRNRRPTLDERIKTLAKNLDLSQAQQLAVKEILEERRQEILQLRVDPSLTGADRIARFRALQTETVEEIRSVLNEEQKKKYDPLAPRKIPPGSHERSVEDWIDSTTPRK